MRVIRNKTTSPSLPSSNFMCRFAFCHVIYTSTTNKISLGRRLKRKRTQMEKINLSAAFNAFRLLYEPQLARPHAVISQFSDLRFPLGKCIAMNIKARFQKDVRVPDIRAVVVDKDNCIAKPHQLELWPAYKVIFYIPYLNLRMPGNSWLTSMARTEC